MIRELYDEISDIIVTAIITVAIAGILLWMLAGTAFFSLVAPLFVMAGIPVDPFWFRILMVSLPVAFVFVCKFTNAYMCEPGVKTFIGIFMILFAFLINIWFLWSPFAWSSIDAWYEITMTKEQKIELIEAKLTDPHIAPSHEASLRAELNRLGVQ